MRRELLVAVGVLLAWGPVVQGDSLTQDDCAEDGDAGNGPSDATPIVHGQLCTGLNEPGGDWYSLQAAAEHVFDVGLETDLESDMLLCLRRPDLTTLRCGNRFYAHTDVNGTHYLSTIHGEGDDYAFRAYFGAQDDCGSGRDAGGNATRAVPGPGFNAPLCWGRFGSPQDTTDWYSYELAQAGRIKVHIVSPANSNHYKGCLVDPAGVELGCATHWPTADLEFDAYAFGRYHVDMRHTLARHTGSYRPNLTLAPFAANDCGLGGDAPASAALAAGVARTAACQGGFLHAGDSDWFAVAVAADDAVRLTRSSPANARLCVIDEAGHDAGCATSFLLGPDANGLVRIGVDNITHGLYAFDVDARAADDCGAARDARAATPVALAVPRSCAGQFLLPEDVEDTYAFDLGAEGDVLVDLATAAPGGRVCLVAPDPRGDACAAAGTRLERAAVSGRWHARVERRASDAIDAYTLGVSLRPPNDCGAGRDARTASPIALLAPASCAGQLLLEDLEDAYAFDVGADAEVLLDLATSSTGARVCLVAPDASDAACAAAGTRLERPVTAGRWHARIDRTAGDAVAAYTLGVDFEAPRPDCGLGGDLSAPSPPMAAFPLSCWGVMGASDVEDAWRFTANAGTVVRADVTPTPGGTVTVCVREPSGAQTCRASATPGAVASVSRTLGVAGDHRIRVLGNGAHLGYSLAASATPDPDECAAGADAGKGASAHRVQGPAVHCEAHVASSVDPVDEYVIAVPEGGSMRVGVTPLTPVAQGALRVCHEAPHFPRRCVGWQSGPILVGYTLAPKDVEWRVSVELVGDATQWYALDLLRTS